MNWQSTLELLKLCFFLVLRTGIVAVTLTCLLLIVVGFNLVIELVLRWLEAPESVANALQQLTLLVVMLIAFAASLTSIVIVVMLTHADIRSLSHSTADNQNGTEDDSE